MRSGYDRAIEALASLTNDDLENISKIDHIGPFSVGSKTTFSTREGLDFQIANFHNEYGFVYLWQRNHQWYHIEKFFISNPCSIDEE